MAQVYPLWRTEIDMSEHWSMMSLQIKINVIQCSGFLLVFLNIKIKKFYLLGGTVAIDGGTWDEIQFFGKDQ